MSEKNQPLVSIILPAFNSEETIEKAVESVLNGTYENYELLIFDDASTDATPIILQKLKCASTKVSVHSSKINRGAGYARNYLLSLAAGEVIAFLDADDVWYKDKLKCQVDLLINRDLQIVTAFYDIKNFKNEKIGMRKPPKFINIYSMHLSNWLPTSFTILRADLKNAHFMPNVRKRQDYAYWLKIFKTNNKVRCGSVKQSVGCYSRHGKGLSSSIIGNLYANFYMFKYVMGYNRIVSLLLVLTNSFVRLLRL